MPLKIGITIDDRYHITSRIGHGGMSEVYEATDVFTHRICALKFIREDVMNNPTNLQRFNNEVRIASALDNPYIVKVYNSGTFENRPYIVNEYVKGQTLKEVLDFRGSLGVKECVSVMLQLSSALDYAHRHNVIHRDIKPDNIFYLPDGSVKLGDFGIAEVSDDRIVKNKNEIVGSVHYLAPELARGEMATARSDIYALGVTFFEILTGKLPFQKKEAVDVAVAHIKEKFPSVKKYLPDCPPAIEKVIMKCVAKKPQERYRNMLELHQELEQIESKPELMKERKGLLSKIFGFK